MVGGLCRGQSWAVGVREEKAVTDILYTQCQHLYPEEVFVIPMGLRHWALNTAVLVLYPVAQYFIYSPQIREICKRWRT